MSHVPTHKHTHTHSHRRTRVHAFHAQIRVCEQTTSIYICTQTVHTQANTAELAAVHVVWLLCIAEIRSTLLVCFHPQTITVSQWTTSAREIVRRRAIHTKCVCERARGRGRGEGKKKEPDEKVGRERGTKEDGGRFEGGRRKMKRR